MLELAVINAAINTTHVFPIAKKKSSPVKGKKTDCEVIKYAIVLSLVLHFLSQIGRNYSNTDRFICILTVSGTRKSYYEGSRQSRTTSTKYA